MTDPDVAAERHDVVIIGAGPSGAVAAASLADKGHDVLVLEREVFPRFSIGESLLPHCMGVLDECGLAGVVERAGFQVKDGAAFHCNGEFRSFDFAEKTSSGPSVAYQVQRAKFDELLADEAARRGADIRYGHTVDHVSIVDEGVEVRFTGSDGSTAVARSRFILDASGFGRVLSRMFGLEKESTALDRVSLFTHVTDDLIHERFDRNKILIVIHQDERDIWYWVIPFADGTASIGVVCTTEAYQRRNGEDSDVLRQLFDEVPHLAELLHDARYANPVRKIAGYSASVESLVGPGYAILGNAGEFLDPVFSSGVTIAMKSAHYAANLLDRQLKGADVDWAFEFERPLRQGVDVFRIFVEAWYDRRLQDIIFHPAQQARVKAMICSILAGYAWDPENPYVAECERRINVLSEICKPATDSSEPHSASNTPPRE